MAGRGSGHALKDVLSVGLDLDVLDGDAIEGELEVVDGPHDGGVEAAGEDLGGERVWGLDEKDAAATIEGQGEEQKWAREQWGRRGGQPTGRPDLLHSGSVR